jgi:hypothetical protein
LTFKGFTIYDNDSYSDLLEKVAIEGKEPLINSLEPVMSGKSEATLNQCEMALAATDLIASLNGKFSDKMPDTIREKVEKINLGLDLNEQVLNVAADIIDIIGTESELKDLWKESNHFDEWTDHLIDIQNRLLT